MSELKNLLKNISPKKSRKFGYISSQTVLFIRKFQELDIIRTSQALAFLSFFSMVPIYVFFIFILSKLSETDALKLVEVISGYILPAYAQDFGEFLNNLAERKYDLGLLSVCLLGLTAILAYIQVEGIINRIWNATEKRKWYKNAFVLINSILLGPFIVFFVFSFSPYLQYVNIFGGIKFELFGSLLSYLASFILLLILLFLVYIYLPVELVKMKSALKGACLAALFIQVANYIVGFYIKKFTAFDTFYGVFAIIPIILIWFFTVWLIIISGSLFTYLDQNYFQGQESIYENTSLSLLNQTLQTLILIMHRFEIGKEPLSSQEICLSTGISAERVRFISHYLKDKGFIYFITKKNLKGTHTNFFQINKSPSTINIKDLVKDLHKPAVIALPLNVSNFLRVTSLHPTLNTDLSLREVYYLADEILEKNSNLESNKSITSLEKPKAAFDKEIINPINKDVSNKKENPLFDPAIKLLEKKQPDKDSSDKNRLTKNKVSEEKVFKLGESIKIPEPVIQLGESDKQPDKDNQLAKNDKISEEKAFKLGESSNPESVIHLGDTSEKPSLKETEKQDGSKSFGIDFLKPDKKVIGEKTAAIKSNIIDDNKR